MESAGRRQFLLSKGWIQAVALVVLCGFFILGLLAYRTYMAHPPVPKQVVDSQGRVLYTGNDISKGQQVFLHNGLMEYGSVFGHGAYLGPDYTADYLRRASDLVTRSYGGSTSDSAGRRTIEDFRTNRYDKQTKTLTLTARAGRRLPRSSSPTTAASSRTRNRPRAAPERDHQPHAAAPADCVLRLDGVGGRRRTARDTTTPTPTTGRPSRASTTRRRPTSSSGRCCR